MTSIEGKTIYITGGASGMGLAAGRMLAAKGAHIVVFDLNPGNAATQAIEASRRSPDQCVSLYRLNVTDRDQVIESFELATRQVEAPDIVINMAGLAPQPSSPPWATTHLTASSRSTSTAAATSWKRL
jgi:NAD(P)-dependent dehydrogenase (short-subunit alcohol dehydrogenase family)